MRAIYYQDDLPAEFEPYLDDNAAFFTDTLPGRPGPLGSPAAPSKSARSVSARRW